MLTDEHIDYITKDLTARGIVLDGLQEELIDHICSAVEASMAEGVRFHEAYNAVLSSFGNTKGLRETQRHTWKAENQKTTTMLLNYMTIAWRNLRKNAFYSSINIFGLAIGIAACLVITVYIGDELNYDTYNTKASRIYRTEAEVKFGGNHFHMTYRSAPEAQTMRQQFPEIESVVRFRQMGSYLVKTEPGTENIKEQHVIWTDSTFFRIFSVNVLEGDPKTALREPASIAISKKMADKYFPGKSALGQSMILDNKYHASVTAVYENIPTASHFHFDILISMVGDWPIAREARETSFLSENFITYLLLREGADVKRLEEKFPAFIETYLGPELSKFLGSDFSMRKFRNEGNKYDLALLPLLDIHLHSNKKGELEPNGSITYVYLLATVAVIILIIACINFMNLSTARSGSRAKEVGVRKVMGSLRSHLVRQFLTESILITTFAIVFAIGLSYLALPLFNSLSQKHLEVPTGIVFYAALAAGGIILGTLAGFYPAFFLSAFKPVSVLKGNATKGMTGGSWIRSGLVVFQFMISIFLIVGAITVNKQLNYIQQKNLGFEKDQVIIIHDAYALRPNNVQSFKNEVIKLSDIESGTISGYIPIESDWAWRSNNTFWREGAATTTDNLVSFQRWSVDYDYLKTFGMKVREGRNFSTDFPSDSSAVILNESAVKRLGLADSPLGKKIFKFDDAAWPENKNIQGWTVIGVIEDFHFSSMKEGITPLGLFLDKSDGSISFRFHPQHAGDVIAAIGKIWKQQAPGQPFQYSFLNEDFERMYLTEQRLGRIFVIFATLAVIIACLGLFALTAFAAQQRTREIGIRKVLGASVKSIFLLLSKDFGKLILIAFVIAAPAAWYAVEWWLSGYSYKTEVGIVVYAVAGILAFVIALITMSFQSIKAAVSDPVKALRSE